MGSGGFPPAGDYLGHVNWGEKIDHHRWHHFLVRRPWTLSNKQAGGLIHHSLFLSTSGSRHCTWSTASYTVPRLFNFMRSHLWIVDFISQVTEVLFRRPTKVCSTCFWNLGKREGLTTGISVKITFTVSLHEEADVTLLLFLESCHSRFLHHTSSSRRHQQTTWSL